MKSRVRRGAWVSAVFVFLTGLFIIPAGALFASGMADRGESRSAWDEGVSYLLAAVARKDAAFDARAVAGLLDFVLSEKGGDANLNPGKRENATGAYFLSEVDVPLAKVVQYAYNPRIPASLTLPSVVRLSGWQVEPAGPFTNLWERIGQVKDPLVMRGIEYEEITPDLKMGAYFRYDMDRMLVLLNHRGKDFFLSVTRQKNPSSVGRKGAIIGPDGDWNYFYSGEAGLNKIGMGWVKSYMYDAFSVTILFEPAAHQPRTRRVTFKWLNAGWNGINMVSRENILEGCRRFDSGFRQVLESPQLPDTERLAGLLTRIKALSDHDLSDRLQPVALALRKIARTDPALSRGDFKRLIESGKYLPGMSREEREHLLLSESLKLTLGKHSLLDKAL
jgi:hypothetical protein